jgi:hypothetical protein
VVKYAWKIVAAGVLNFYASSSFAILISIIFEERIWTKQKYNSSIPELSLINVVQISKNLLHLLKWKFMQKAVIQCENL